jgi:nitrogen regulatory protein PII
MLNKTDKYELIVTIVNKGNANAVVDASKKAGAEGGTIIYGRGSGIHEKTMLFSLMIEPEKEIVLTLIKADITERVLESIISETNLNEPGNGVAFVMDVEATAGICHAFKQQQEQEK